MTEQQNQPAPFLHAYSIVTHRDNRRLVVEERVTTAGVAPRGFAKFEAVALLGLREVSEHGERVVPHEIRAELPEDVTLLYDAFIRFHEFMEPAAREYIKGLQRQAAERPRIVRAGVAPQGPTGG